MISIKIEGNRGSGKSTIANIIERALKENGFNSVCVDDGLNVNRSFPYPEYIKALGARTRVKINVNNKYDRGW